MIQEIIDFLNTYIKAHGCTEMNKWVEFLEQLGWHPVSNPPKEGVKVLLLSYGATSADEVEYIKGMGYVHITSGTILRYPKPRLWCYLPKED